MDRLPHPRNQTRRIHRLLTGSHIPQLGDRSHNEQRAHESAAQPSETLHHNTDIPADTHNTGTISPMNLNTIANVVDAITRSVHQPLWHHWYTNAKKRAEANLTWAQIEQRRHIPGREGTKMFLSDDLTMDDWDTQTEIFDTLNPTPWWQRLHWWNERHGTAAQLRTLHDFLERGKNGYSTRDTWDLCNYLDTTIADAVDQLRRNLHGHPSQLTIGEWDDILARISYGLRTSSDAEPGTPEHKAKQTARTLLFTYYDDLWD